MSQGIAQQCNDILVLGDLRNGSKLSNYSASSPPICKHDFARRSASASATSLSVSVNGQGVSRGVGTSESLVIACVRFESCLSPRLREGSHRARGHSPPPPFHSMLLQSQSTASRRRPKARPRCFHGAALPTGPAQPRRFARAPACDKPRGGVEAGGCEGTAWVPGSSRAHTRPCE